MFKLFKKNKTEERFVDRYLMKNLEHFYDQRNFLMTKKCINNPDYLNSTKDITNNLGENPIFLACKYDDIDVLKIILNSRQRINLNKKNILGNTAFHTACDYRSINVIRFIVSNRKYFKFFRDNQPGYVDRTPLSISTYNFEIFKLLFENMDFDKLFDETKYLGTIFHSICNSNQTEIIEYLLSTGKLDLNRMCTKGISVFHSICCANNPYFVRQCLNNPKLRTLNTPSKYENAPIYSACYLNNHEVVKELLKHPDIIIPKNIDYGYFRGVLIPSKCNVLIESYLKNPDQFRNKLLFEDNLDIYRLIVFTCDNYFTIKQNQKKRNDPNAIATRITRFMKIIVRLPLELQMVLIQRMSGSTRNNITSSEFNDKLDNFVKHFLKNDNK